jgi:Tol biopolymer transport system component
MAIQSGSRLGSYEVISLLGAGGMGEVYRARDPRLGREVAIKVLPETLSKDPEHLARFEREARSLAALNHPNVAAIYGIETTGDSSILVLELVEGETLADRLLAGPMPVPEALSVARQVAAAIEAAHARGIVHRDLKPANIKLTPDGKVKVLDFGLARSLEEGDPAASRLPTVAQTQPGTVLGTPSYMSPEQARGKLLDQRTDLWSFGCVLYELLSGRRAFEGDSASDVLAAVLSAEPDWSRLPPSTPPRARDLLRRCLDRDASRRPPDAGSAGLDLDAALAELARPPAGETHGPAGSSLLRSLSSLFRSSRPRRDREVSAAPPRLSQVTFAEEIEQSPAWSPEGERLVFCRETGVVRKIIVKELRSGRETQATRGDFDDIQPEWSADGRFLLFVRAREPGKRLEPADVFGAYDGTDVWSLEVATGRESRLLENAANPSCSPDKRRIAVDASWAGPRRLWVCDERGRNPEQVTSDASEAVVHTRPRWSPDGRRLVFQSIERTRFDVRVVDVASKAMSWVTNDPVQDICPVWSPSGFLYFSSQRSGGLNLWRIPVNEAGEPSGALAQLTNGAGQDVEAAISRDGKRLAFTILRQNADIWRLPVSPASGRPTGPPEKVIATTREGSRGAWSRDGKRIAFNSDRAGDMNIWLFSFEGGLVRQLTRGAGGDFQPSFSPDGRQIAFFSSRAGSVDVWVVGTDGGRPRRLTPGPSISVNPAFSPDGRLIAFMSDEGGRLEVWVMEADGGRRRPLTDVGVSGHFLQWTADGQAIVFRCPAGRSRSMKVSLSGGESG